MTVTRDRFEQGMTYEEYKAQMTRNRDRLEENERTVALSEADVAFFKQLPEPLNVLVLVEDWCGDVVANVPVLARLAEESGTLTLRFFLRDQNLDLMDQYLNEGKFRSIPTVVFFDQDFREIGHWIERPTLITEMRGQMLNDLFATDPAMAGVSRDTSPALLPDAARLRLFQAFGTFRAETRETPDREVVREIRELLAHNLTSA